MAEQYALFITTLLPTAPEMLGYAGRPASTSLALSRALTRASSGTGALTVGV